MSSRFDKLVSGHRPSVDVEVMNDEAPRDVKTRYLRLGDLERHPSNRAVHERNVEWIAESIEKEQLDIFAEFEGADGSRIWLAQEMQLRDDRQAEKLVARAERDLSSNARLMARAKAKGRELDEAAIRSAIENLARLLEG